MYSDAKEELAQRSLRDWQAEFGKDFFHILPDPFAVFRRVISQQIGSVIRRHKFYGRPAEAGVVSVELAAQLAYRLVGV